MGWAAFSGIYVNTEGVGVGDGGGVIRRILTSVKNLQIIQLIQLLFYSICMFGIFYYKVMFEI